MNWLISDSAGSNGVSTAMTKAEDGSCNLVVFCCGEDGSFFIVPASAAATCLPSVAGVEFATRLFTDGDGGAGSLSVLLERSSEVAQDEHKTRKVQSSFHHDESNTSSSLAFFLFGDPQPPR